MVVDEVLGLEAEAVAEGPGGLDLPVVLGVEAKVGGAGGDCGGGDLGDGVVSKIAGDVVLDAGVAEGAVGAGGGGVGVAGGAEAAAGADEVVRQGYGGVVLELDVVLNVRRSAGGGTAGVEGALDVDEGGGGEGCLG